MEEEALGAAVPPTVPSLDGQWLLAVDPRNEGRQQRWSDAPGPSAVRQVCGKAGAFCVVPPLGVHRSEIQAAVSARNQAGDNRVYLVDLASLESGFRVGQGATVFGYDGVHPSVYGNAMLGTVIVA